MNSDSFEPTYARGSFPKGGIHSVITSRTRRLRPEEPKTHLERLGAKVVAGEINMTYLWAASGILFVITLATLGLGSFLFLPMVAFAGVAHFSQRLWGRRGDPNRPDRLVIKVDDVDHFLETVSGGKSVMVYAEALAAVMRARLESDEYQEMSVMLKDLLHAEIEAKAKRADLQSELDRLAGHDPKGPLEEKRSELRQTTNLATRQYIEKNISVLEKQLLRREHLRSHIQQLAAQEALAIELMRSMGECTMQIDKNPYLAISPILESARNLVHAMDHEVLAVESAIVEMEVSPVKIAVANESIDLRY